MPVERDGSLLSMRPARSRQGGDGSAIRRHARAAVVRRRRHRRRAVLSEYDALVAAIVATGAPRTKAEACARAQLGVPEAPAAPARSDSASGPPARRDAR